MKDIKSLIRKDIKEIKRSKKLLILIVCEIVMSAMVLFATLLFPTVISFINNAAPDLLKNLGNIDSVMTGLLPDDLSECMGLWSADMGMFYTIVLTVLASMAVPNEIKAGKWIIPVNAGFKKKNIVLSKAFVYGIFGSVSVFVSYMLYYLIGLLYLERNLSFINGFVDALALSVGFFAVAADSVLLSYIVKSAVLPAFLHIITILIVPDVFSLFDFGKYFPTHVFTFAYNSMNRYNELVVPIAEIILIMALLLLWVSYGAKDRKIYSQ